MNLPLQGIRVVEVAAWTFVPAAGALLADLGADVIKIEPPTGDPQRGLANMLNLSSNGPNPFTEVPNRGKRSVTLDLTNPGGRETLLKLAANADVFLTSYLPQLRRKLRIDVDDVRAVAPGIVYVRGSGWGSEGPMAETGGYDLASAWASSGMAYRLTPPGGEPPFQPPAYYDLQGANTIAGAIAMALFKRERTGEPSEVDVSLLNVGMWSLAPDIVGAPYVDDFMRLDRKAPGNPITNGYRTSDGRWLYLVLLQADRFWAELCGVLDRPDLVEHTKFANAMVRFENRVECVEILDAVFASRTLDQWRERFHGFSGVWAPVLSFLDLHEHAQVAANGYLPEIDDGAGAAFRLVSPPMHFDGVHSAPRTRAPELGQHTEDVLLEAGLDWDEISALREQGALG